MRDNIDTVTAPQSLNDFPPLTQKLISALSHIRDIKTKASFNDPETNEYRIQEAALFEKYINAIVKAMRSYRPPARSTPTLTLPIGGDTRENTL